jgi:RHS repeat-associated protein
VTRLRCQEFTHDPVRLPYDDIGNRRTASLNAQISTYVADALNRYTSRTVPAVVPVLGRAAADATVQVNHAAPARQDDWFYAEVAAPNGSGPQSVTLAIGGVQTTAAPEIAAYARRTAFVPQSPEAFTYDADGNLLQDGRWTYTWDAENRLSALETRADVAGLFPALRLRLEFAYDVAGRRLRKQVKTWNGSTWSANSDRRFLYDGWNLAGEFEANLTTSALTLVRTYTWGLDLSGSLQGAGGVGGLLWTTAGSLTHAFASDGNGNVIASFDSASGALAHETDFGPFGEPIPLAGARPGACGFSSKYTDLEAGLLYYGRRYYDPKTGRWLSCDPKEELGGLHLYGFVGNNPIGRWDRLGLDWKTGDTYTHNGNNYVIGDEENGFGAYLNGEGINNGFTDNGLTVSHDVGRDNDDAGNGGGGGDVASVPDVKTPEEKRKDVMREISAAICKDAYLKDDWEKAKIYTADLGSRTNGEYRGGNPPVIVINSRLIDGTNPRIDLEGKDYSGTLEQYVTLTTVHEMLHFKNADFAATFPDNGFSGTIREEDADVRQRTDAWARDNGIPAKSPWTTLDDYFLRDQALLSSAYNSNRWASMRQLDQM